MNYPFPTGNQYLVHFVFLAEKCAQIKVTGIDSYPPILWQEHFSEVDKIDVGESYLYANEEIFGCMETLPVRKIQQLATS